MKPPAQSCYHRRLRSLAAGRRCSVRPAIFDTGAGCRRNRDGMPYAVPAADRRWSCAARWRGRHLGRGLVSTGPRQPRVGALRLAVGLGVDAEGGPPHSHVADECGARVPSRRSPDWLSSARCEVSDAAGVGDRLVAWPGRWPRGDGPASWWNAGSQGSGPWVGRRELCEAPVEDGGHVACGVEVASKAAVSRWRSGCCPVSPPTRAGVPAGLATRVQVVSPGGTGRLGRALPQSGVRRAVRLRHEGRRCSAGPPGRAGPLDR